MKKIKKLKLLKLSKDDQASIIGGCYRYGDKWINCETGGYEGGGSCGGCGFCEYQDGGPGFNIGMSLSGLSGPSCNNIFVRT